MSGSFTITQIVAPNEPFPIFQPLIYTVEILSRLSGYAIPFGDPLSVPGLAITEDVPVLRVVKADGTFAFAQETSGSTYSIFVSWDQQSAQTAQLWQGTAASATFALSVDLTKSGVAAFTLTPR